MSAQLTFIRYPLTTGLSLGSFFGESKERRGIYVLTFTDGTEYVGQAVDILSRYRSHARRHGDSIVCIDFAPTSRLSLENLELLTIRWRQKNGAKLRNRLLVGPVGAHDHLDHWAPSTFPLSFDVLPVENRLETFDRVERNRTAIQSTRSFVRLITHPDAQSIIDTMALFLYHALPRPGLAEQTSWVVTAMPRSDDGVQRLACLTLHNIQVLTFIDVNSRSTQVIMNLAEKPRLDIRYYPRQVNYHPVHETMQRVQLDERSAIEALYHDPDLSSAVRLTASNLIQRGTSLISGFHCRPLADAIYASAARSVCLSQGSR
jgi:hypothetical protein